jgi:hypothetical protein
MVGAGTAAPLSSSFAAQRTHSVAVAIPERVKWTPFRNLNVKKWFANAIDTRANCRSSHLWR